MKAWIPQTCAEINLDHLAWNINAIQSRVSPAKVIPVVKANAYGHGVIPVTQRLLDEGYTFFAVARFEEAMELREAGIDEPVLIFGRLFPGELPEAIRQGFRITLSSVKDIRWIGKAGGNIPANVHVNVETGMGRVGVMPEQDTGFLNELIASRQIEWEGCYSHFSTSDEKDKSFAFLQLSRFRKLLDTLHRGKWYPSMVHMANSGAILDIPESYFDAVRPGILMYGHYPSGETTHSIEPRQAMTFKTYVSHVRTVPKDHPISYGRKWIAPKKTRIAVIPVGYADGLRRDLTNKGEVLIRGKRYPLVGTITMDQTMVHIGDDPVCENDEVIIWGESPQGCIQALEVAEKINTIAYELTCGVSPRVKRIYTGKTRLKNK